MGNENIQKYAQKLLYGMKMKPMRECPHRSPMAVSEAIQDILKDKVVCELGCAEGDNMVFMSRYAKEIVGMELMESRYRHAEKRGVRIVVGDYFKDPLPKADVYYFWPDDGQKDNEALVERILQTSFKGTIIVAGDTGFPKEIPSVKRCAEKWGRSMEVEFNEGPLRRQSGTFLLAIIEVT